MADNRGALRDGIPIGDLERTRDLIIRYKGWTDEWDFVRDAVRRRLEEFGQEYPPSHRP